MVIVKTEETNQSECNSDLGTEELLYTNIRNSLNLLTMPKRKQATNLNYIRGFPKTKTDLTLKRI